MKSIEFFKQRESGCENGIYKVHFEEKDKFTKMTIDDDIVMQDYSMAIRSNGDNLKTFVFAVVWNDEKQMVNRGTYYAFTHRDRKYNIAVTEDKVLIDETTPFKKGTIEKRLVVENSGEYDYFKCRHDEMGSTHDMEYFTSRNETFLAREIGREEFDEDLKMVFSCLETFDGLSEFDNDCENLLNKMKNVCGASSELAE